MIAAPRLLTIASGLALGWTLAGCGVSGTASGLPSSTSADSPLGSPSASATAAGSTSSPRPSLRYPDVQSHGIVIITFTSPAIEPLSIDLACEWVAPTEVGSFYPQDPVVLSTEPVWIEFQPRAEDERRSFSIGREGAAGYQPSSTTGNVWIVDASPD